MALKIPAGLDGVPTNTIPDDPAQFVSWFKSVGIKRWLANADARNARSGTGISITGNIATPATVSVNENVQALFAQPYILVGAPVAPAVLTDYRSIAVQAGVISLADGGAASTIMVGVVNNGIGNAQIRQGAAHSVIGNAGSTTANVSDLSQAQLTALINVATASLSGALPILSGSSSQFINGVGAWAVPAYPVSANPSASIGLSAVNGIAATFMASDSAPALSQAIAPTWTHLHTFSPASGEAILVNAASGALAIAVNSTGATKPAVIVYEQAASTSAEIGTDGTQSIVADSTNGDLVIRSFGAIRFTINGTATQMRMGTDGGIVVGAPTGGDEGLGTLNATGLYVNGTAVSTAVSANPTGTIGLSAVNGSATTYMRSDGAPALSQSISPTWSGSHTFNNALTLASTGTGALNANGTLNGGTTVEPYQNNSAYGSGVTSTAIGFLDAPSTSAAAFTCSALRGFQHNDVSVGSGSAVTTQIGFFCGTMVGGTNNRAFVGQVASASNAYNLYMQGTALNYLAGKLLIGSSSDSGGGEILQVTGTASITGALGVNGASPPAQVTGWGTPTGASVVASFPGGGPATLAQCSNAIAKIITDLKALGIYGA